MLLDLGLERIFLPIAHGCGCHRSASRLGFSSRLRSPPRRGTGKGHLTVGSDNLPKATGIPSDIIQQKSQRYNGLGLAVVCAPPPEAAILAGGLGLPDGCWVVRRVA